MASASSPIDLVAPQEFFCYEYYIFLKGSEIVIGEIGGKKQAVPHLVAYSKHNLFILLREQIQYEGETPFITPDNYIFDNVLVPRDAIAGIKIFAKRQKYGAEQRPTEMAEHQL